MDNIQDAILFLFCAIAAYSTNQTIECMVDKLWMHGVQITSRTNFYCRDTSDLKVKQEAPSEKVKHGITL